MKNKTYTVKGNKTAADAVAGNDEILETGYTEELAVIAAVEYQKVHRYVAAWIEEEASADAPQPPEITRNVEQDCRTHERYTVVRINGWVI